MIPALLAVLLPAQLGVPLPADSIATLRSRARSAEARYERLSRSLAPWSWGGSGQSCDEIVGRFCIRFDSLSSPPAAPVRSEVADARREAVESLRRYFSAAPQALAAAGPLVRLLVDDGRAREAASAAGAFAVLSRDTLWSALLLGLAHHAALEDSSAEQHFRAALMRMDSVRRARWTDVTWLLDGRERSVVRRMSEAERTAYERMLWHFADPFWLTSANERWVEHMARHTQSELLSDVPIVTGMTSWADDMTQLTVRYGTPTAREQYQTTGMMPGRGMVEYWDTAARAYVPERLRSSGLPEPLRPGERPHLYSARARSGYAWRGATSVLELPHQITRFLQGSDIVLRVDALLRADSAPARSSLEAALFAADATLIAIRGTRSRIAWQGDSAAFTLLLTASPGRTIYSVEAIDTAADVAARARYAIPTDVPADAPVLSDILVCAPFPSGVQPARYDDRVLRARSSLVLARGDTIGIFAEAYRLRSRGSAAVEVEVSLERTESASLVRQFGAWLGRTLGITRPVTEPRVTWRAHADGGVHALSLNLPLDPRLRGYYALVLKITDTSTGRSASSRREVLIRE